MLKKEMEDALNAAAPQLIAAFFVFSKPEKFTEREVEMAKEHWAAAAELLKSLGYDPEKASMRDPDPKTPSFLTQIAGREALIPHQDGKTQWVVKPGQYMSILETQYPNYKN